MKSFDHQFLDWLRSKPADGWYDFRDIQTCAMAQFVRENFADVESTHGHFFVTPMGQIPYPAKSYYAAAGRTGRFMGDWTFGAAARRLENALQPDAPAPAPESVWTDHPAMIGVKQIVYGVTWGEPVFFSLPAKPAEPASLPEFVAA